MIDDNDGLTYLERCYFYNRRSLKLERQALVTAALVASGKKVTIVAVDEQSARKQFDRVRRIISDMESGADVSG